MPLGTDLPPCQIPQILRASVTSLLRHQDLELHQSLQELEQPPRRHLTGALVWLGVESLQQQLPSRGKSERSLNAATTERQCLRPKVIPSQRLCNSAGFELVPEDSGSIVVSDFEACNSPVCDVQSDRIGKESVIPTKSVIPTN